MKRNKGAGETMRRMIETLKSSISNASSVAKGKNRASANSSNAKGGARSVMKRSKGGNENMKREDASTGETLRRILETLNNSISNASSVAKGKNRASANSSNAKGGARSVMKRNKGGNENKKREDASAGETMRRILETLNSSISNASSVARGKNRASANNSNVKGGARSVMKRNKGGNENKKKEDASTGETLRRILETLNSSISNANSVARGKNRASVNNSNAKGGASSGTKGNKGGNESEKKEGKNTAETRETHKSSMSSASDSAKGIRGARSSNYAREGASSRDNKKKESTNAEDQTDKIRNNDTSNANADVRHKSKAHKDRDSASNDANSNAENGEERETHPEKDTIPTIFTRSDSSQDTGPKKVMFGLWRGSQRGLSSFVALTITAWSSWKQILTPLCSHTTSMRILFLSS